MSLFGQPATYDLQTGDLRPLSPRSTSWTTEDQVTTNVSDSLVNVGGFFGALGIAHAVGHIPTKTGNVYDWYVNTIRAAEEYSPVNILRTFQLGNFLSQFSSVAQQPSIITSDVFIKNEPIRRYMTALIGGGEEISARLMREGVRLVGGSLYYGSGDVALEHARLVLNAPRTALTQPSAYWSAAYARSIGIDDYSNMWKGPQLEALFAKPTVEGYGAQIIGGHSHLQHYTRQASAWGTELVSRFNRLLNNPFELIGADRVMADLQRIPLIGGAFKYGLGVKPGGGLSTFARLAGKWGIAATGLYLGWQEMDRVLRTSDLAEGTILEEGLNVGAASLWVKANMLAAETSQVTGWHAYKTKQEELFPGSTSLSRLAAFPIMGALAGASIGWGRRVLHTAVAQGQGMSLVEASQFGRTMASEWSGAIFGPLGKIFDKIPGLRGRAPFSALVTAGAVAGLALISPFLPGALAPEHTPEELQAIYSGEEEVAIRKGRWWELGRTAWEGENVSYYAPHWYPRMRWQAKERMLWGEDWDQISEWEKFYKREFTYELEHLHYEDRPYPQTATALEDVPLIGPILGATIGQFIKPSVRMHTEEWVRPQLTWAEGGDSSAGPDDKLVLKEAYVPLPSRFGQSAQTTLGQLPEGRPISPYDISQVAGEQIYRLSEMVGLPGFTTSAIKEQLTGSQDWFDEERQIETSRRMFGAERGFWEEELGGMFGTNEAFRRLYPHRRRQIPLYNPLKNTMPEWLPGPGERSEDFLSGDPYSKIPLGEIRLPGEGYALRYPELKGVDPSDYPLIHRFKILGNVAPFSSKFKTALSQVQAALQRNELTDEQIAIYERTMQQVQDIRQRKDFNRHNYLEPYANDHSSFESNVLAEINKAKAEKQPDKGLIASIFGSYWEWIAHNAETPIEQITPLAPSAKLVHMRDPVEDYERTQLYGNQMAFWQNPIEDFAKPFMSSVARSSGWTGIPSDVQQVRDLEEYFDILKYVKYHKLATEAIIEGDIDAAKNFMRQRSQTLFGLNPYTRSAGNIFSALPRRERDYFSAFLDADTSGEKARILEMIPENERMLYVAQWQLGYSSDVKDAVRDGVISGAMAEKAAEQAQLIDAQSRTEGVPTSQDLYREYLEGKLSGESYADWYRRTKLIARRLNELGRNLPGPDWVGFHPHVDLEDIKLKLVQNLGEDMHSYDLWPEQERALRYKPYINNQALEELQQPAFTEHEMRDRLDSVFHARELRGNYTTSQVYSLLGKNSVNINIEQDREGDIKELLRSRLG